MRFLLALVIAICAVVPASADPFYAPTNPDPGVPSPEAFLGYTLGTRYTEHHRIVDYLRVVAAASDRVEIEQYGATYEGRPLLLLTVSSPANLAGSSEIRREYLDLADPRSLPAGDAQRLARELPVAVWLSFNIHGNETSSSEAAMAAAYYLAADRSPATTGLLEESVVLIDPCLNPDGRDRYVNWLRGVEGSQPDPDPAAREHQEPWPGGRYNHYLFDLNRDWAWLSQTESQARARAYLAWMPQVHVDFHEMGAGETYFFFPPERPVHALYPPEVRTWGEIFGRGNAAAFDRRGWRYYTAESFDLYYPGYGDSWPTFQGAVGMTYEQAGHSRAGTVIRLDDGDELTLSMRAEHHFGAALATVNTAVTNREARLLDFHKFFAADKTLSPRAYLFPPGNDPARTAQLISLLMEHGAEVSVTREEIHSRELRDYDGRPFTGALPEGTYVVSLDQPRHRFLRAVLDPEAALPDTLFYDVSAWSLPLAFGVNAYASSGNITPRLEQLTAHPEFRGRILHPDATYAFIVPWSTNGAPRAAAELLRRGCVVHFATREFTSGGTRFPPGSLVLFTAENRDRFPAALEKITAFGTDVVGVDSGLTENGPDLGSGRVRRLEPVRAALVSGPPAAPPSLGTCWFLLDRTYGIPYSLLDVDQLTARNLADYDVLIFPDDWSNGRRWAEAVDSSRVEVIRNWVREGGVFVGLGGGAFFAGSDVSGLSSVAEAPDPGEDADLDDDEQAERDRQRKLEPTRDREERLQREDLPGTIFKVRVDPLQPLGFGYSGEARVLKIGRRALELGPEGTNVAVFTQSSKVSGYAQEETVNRLADLPFLIDEPVGRGHVVLYVEDPNFRLFWYGLNRLFLNSILFLPNL